ncbi:hypothetical protein V5O48_002924 [Marasmius crinis-equi]|uniref:NodB homology domain-containing protein n=1 Tax=Marasmius crinis-equi TaxID=585013 RepID=A0ABR3FUT2_9AGAR
MAYARLLLLLPLALQLLCSTATTVPATQVEVSPRAAAQVLSECTQPNTIALTFDDGPYKYLTQFVDLLDAHGAKGTFFFNGNNYDCIYNDKRVKDLQYAYGRGHQVASHTWHHSDLGKIKNETKMNDEFSRTEEALNKILGVDVAMTRPPFGSYNDLTRDVAAKRRQSLITWDLDTRDADGASYNYSINEYEKAAKKNLKNILALNHEPYETTLNKVIPRALELFQGKYKFVTVAECLGMEAYHSVGTPSPRDKSWKC